MAKPQKKLDSSGRRRRLILSAENGSGLCEQPLNSGYPKVGQTS